MTMIVTFFVGIIKTVIRPRWLTQSTLRKRTERGVNEDARGVGVHIVVDTTSIRRRRRRRAMETVARERNTHRSGDRSIHGSRRRSPFLSPQKGDVFLTATPKKKRKTTTHQSSRRVRFADAS
jgi:hypothetical protein